MVEPDNLVLTLLRELRADIEAFRSQAEARADAIEQRLDKIERRLEIMHTNGDKALRQFIGHRAMVERSMASFEVDQRELKRRVELLENAEG